MNAAESIIAQMEAEGIRKVEYYIAGYWSIVFTDGSNMVIHRVPDDIAEAAE